MVAVVPDLVEDGSVQKVGPRHRAAADLRQRALLSPYEVELPVVIPATSRMLRIFTTPRIAPGAGGALIQTGYSRALQ